MVNGRDFPEKDDENLLRDLQLKSTEVGSSVVILCNSRILTLKKLDLSTNITINLVMLWQILLAHEGCQCIFRV